jgi:heme a synthase
LRCRPVVRSRIVVLGALIALTVFLAVLGRFTTGNPMPAIVIGNVVAGMALMALFWRLRLEFLPRESYSRPDRRLSALATSARSLSALQIWLGSWVAGLIVAIDCKSWNRSGELTAWPDSAAWSALNPFASSANSGAALSEALNWLTMVHEISAAFVLIVVAMLCISLRRSGGGLHRNAPVLLALLVVQILLGITMVFSGPALWIGVLHNAVAALLLAKLIDVHFRLHRT